MNKKYVWWSDQRARSSHKSQEPSWSFFVTFWDIKLSRHFVTSFSLNSNFAKTLLGFVWLLSSRVSQRTFSRLAFTIETARVRWGQLVTTWRLTMKRRYSCQSWNVAARVVIYPDYLEEEFVTARQSLSEEDDSESEILETCVEDISEQTVRLSDSTSETLGKSSKYKIFFLLFYQ